MRQSRFFSFTTSISNLLSKNNAIAADFHFFHLYYYSNTPLLSLLLSRKLLAATCLVLSNDGADQCRTPCHGVSLVFPVGDCLARVTNTSLHSSVEYDKSLSTTSFSEILSSSMNMIIENFMYGSASRRQFWLQCESNQSSHQLSLNRWKVRRCTQEGWAHIYTAPALSRAGCHADKLK